MKSKQNARRRFLFGGAALTVVLPSQWSKPIVNAIVLPAHAQTSEPPVEPTCSRAATGNVVFGPISGGGAQPQCTVTFDVLSADSTEIIITNIENSALLNGASVTYNGFGTATQTTGPRVVWQGNAVEAPFCSTVSPSDPVSFTVTYTCDGVNGEEFTQIFELSDIVN